MPDALTLLMIWCGVLTAGIFGLVCVVQNLSGLVMDLARLQQDADAKIASLLARTDRRTVANEAAIVDEWRAAAEAAPEGSPKREAFLARLRELGAD